MKLGQAADSRNNNFNLIRMVAALAVLFSHAYPLTGRNDDEPATRLLGMSLGDIAVDIFFFVSGLLVTGSLVKRRSGRDFVRARLRRIYPGLWVMLALLVFGLGAMVSAVPIQDYLASGETWKYLLRNATLVTGIKFSLPGVFTDNPYPRSVNGSLWTMSFEVRLYLILVLAWAALRFVPLRRDDWFRGLVAVTAVAMVVARIALELHGTLGDWDFIRLSALFFSGAACYMFRHRIRLEAPLAFVLVSTLVAAHWHGSGAFVVAYNLLLGWLLLHAAYLCTPWVHRYNRLGDYSYGVYIYAFPVEQTLAHFLPAIGPTDMVCLAAPVTLALAVLSWHLIEKPVLARKRPEVPQEVRRVGEPLVAMR